MSKFVFKHQLANAEKRVNPNLIDDFFTVLKSGKLSEIQTFLNQNNIRLGVRSNAKGSAEISETPAHIILKLDETVANNSVKLEILKFLKQHEIFLDFQNSSNVWPIHLAASIQNPEIVDFFIQAGVNINRKDASNNTPLHYAVQGMAVDCPLPVTVRPLIGAPTVDKINFNTVLKKIHKAITEIINTQPQFSSEVRRIAETITSIPETYFDADSTAILQKDLENIYADNVLNPKHAVNHLNSQQTDAFNRLIDKAYTLIREEILSKTVQTYPIAAHNKGWGPTLNGAPPSDADKILHVNKEDLVESIKKKYDALRDQIFNVSSSKITSFFYDEMPEMIDTTKTNFENFFFCKSQKNDAILIAERYILTKVLIFFLVNYTRINFHCLLAMLVIKYVGFMNPQTYGEIVTGSLLRRQTYLAGGALVYFNPATRYPTTSMMTTSLTFLSSIARSSIITFSGNAALANSYQNIHDALGLDQNAVRNIHIIRLLPHFCNSLPNPQPFNLQNLSVAQDGPAGGSVVYNLNPEDIKVSYSNPLSTTTERLLTNSYAFYNIEKDMALIDDARLARILPKSWFDLVTGIITKSKPQTNVAYAPGLNNNIFFDAATGNYQFPLMNLPCVAAHFPVAPGIPNFHSFNGFTYLEAIRVMYYLKTFLQTNNYDPLAYPPFLTLQPSLWLRTEEANLDAENITTLNPRRSVKSVYPVFYLLYKILLVDAVQFILRNIETAYFDAEQNIRRLGTLSPAQIGLLNQNNQGFRYRDMFAQLLPLEHWIYTDQMYAAPGNIPMRPYQTETTYFQKSHAFVSWFQILVSNNFTRDFILEIQRLMLSNTAFMNVVARETPGFTTADTHRKNLSNLIRSIYIIDPDLFTNILAENKFKSAISKFFDLRNSVTTNIPVMPIQNFLKIFYEALQKIYWWPSLIQFKTMITGVKNSSIRSNSTIQWMTNIEIYGYVMIVFYRMFQDISQNIENILIISSDVVSMINQNFLQHIPQILLPTMLKYIMDTVEKLNILRYFLFYADKSIFSAVVYPTKDETKNITLYITQFVALGTQQITTLYDFLKIIINHHNLIIDYLNMHSSYTIYHAVTPTVENVFDKTLPKFKPLPENMQFFPEDMSGIFLDIVNKYTLIDNVSYYNSVALNEANFRVFFPFFASINNYRLYRNIYLNRTGSKLTPFRGNPNFQLNVNQNALLLVDEIVPANPLTGKILHYTPGVAMKFSFFDAFIGYTMAPFTRPTDKYFSIDSTILDEMISAQKFNLITDIVQFMIDNQNNPATEFQDFWQKLGSINSVDNANVSFIYTRNVLILTRLVYHIIMGLLDYAIRQTARKWILKIASIPTITNYLSQNVITFINNNEEDRLNLAKYNRKALQDLINNGSLFIDTELSHVEPDVLNIPFSSQPRDPKFITYLYQKSYIENSSKIAECHYVNPLVVESLISGEVINAPNANGETPLHVAVIMGSFEIIETLLAKGAKCFSFYNFKRQTPWDLAVENLNVTLNYVETTSTVANSLEKFIKTFNDMLLNTLLTEEYKNNVLTDITLGIPLQLIAYNHIFYIYLQNYRYGFSDGLKVAINEILTEECHPNAIHDYPFDVFELDPNKLDIALQSADGIKRAESSVTNQNNAEIRKKQTQLNYVQNQINGLLLEKSRITERNKILMIDAALVTLRNQATDIQADISSLKLPTTLSQVRQSQHRVYQNSLQQAFQNIPRADVGLASFYQNTSTLLSQNVYVTLQIFKSYLSNPLPEAPSLIFVQLMKHIKKIVTNEIKTTDAKIREKIASIIEFMEIVKHIIQNKTIFPKQYDENSYLKEEMEIIQYILKIVITPRVKNIILQKIRDFIIGSTQNTNYENQTSEILRYISEQKYHNKTLGEYLENELPITITKYISNVYQNNQDPDRSIILLKELFQPIMEIIQKNNIVEVAITTTAITQFENVLISFIANSYEKLIQHLSLTIYGFERFILNFYQQLKIINLMLNTCQT